ncbi:SKP1-like protein 1A [Carica papaya]|uniref:SKP1-like protein 1A n=1 Tax=Carica papaya TaxID=3649 RepID=UPI000B8CF75F|nr:SKP1-like protein 1A [Carica papaya]XP_021901135.1 SKP1-like protein 1A [Carica papaya]
MPSDEAKKKSVLLKTADGKIFQVEMPIAMEFATVKSFFEENSDASAESVEMPLPNVSADALSNIITYCKRSLDLRAKAASDNEVNALNAEFVKKHNIETLRDILVAANYLDIKPLLDLLCSEIADRIKNKSVEFVRTFFGIENDYTEEEEARLRQQNAWAFEGVDPDD